MKIENIKKKFSQSLFFNEKLSKYSWFNLGGPAEIFFKPKKKEELIEFLKLHNKVNQKITVIGAGSNTLLRDKGIKGLTIKLGKAFAFHNLVDKNILEVGSATLDRNVSIFALENSLSGLEFLSCIPGSIGGAIIMNSGCYNEEISKILISFKTVNFSGEEKEFEKKDIKFFYRGSSLSKNEIIVSAKLQGIISTKESIIKKQKKFLEEKKLAQPTGVKTCGSTFKNPVNAKAWSLIKQSNCADLSYGDAKISKKHCNFFVNDGQATSTDIEKLIKAVQEKVLKEKGVKLDLEIKVIGDTTE